MHPGSNIPYWSLNYEAWYYILFASTIFLTGRRRIITLVVSAVLAGPKILLLWPIWLMGVGAWRWRYMLPAQFGIPLAFGALLSFAGIEALGGQNLFWQAETPWLTDRYSAYDYIVGAIVALLITGLANSPLPMPGLTARRLIRRLSGTSFGLYLLHYPLLNFFGTVIPGPIDGVTHRILLFGLVLGASLALSQVIEQQKGTFKSAIRAGLDMVHGKHLPPNRNRQGPP